ncbi:MAG: hypothetical protein U1F48_05515 [Burkholderiales bacterium]
MDQAWLNGVRRLEYGDPRGFLARLRKIEPLISNSALPEAVRTLRTNSLREWKEAREAALFCVGMSERMGTPIRFAKSENHDYDFVATWLNENTRHFAPVQLKEVVPSKINAKATLQALIEQLGEKYVDSPDLTVAIYLNRDVAFDVATLEVPPLRLAALWVFGGISPDQSRWGLWGDLLGEPIGTRFEYPA